MITIEHRVVVPEDRTLEVILPPQVPVGNAEILIVINPGATSPAAQSNTLWDFYGTLKDSPNFNEDPVVIQRRLRDEWDHCFSA